jgi:AcrR family transcriptional regulator
MSASSPKPRARGRPAGASAALDAAQILAAALAAIESGTGELRMRGIATALGVDPMALYHYFPSKQALLEAVLAERFAALERLPARWRKTPDPVERLRLLAEAYLRSVAPLPRLARQLAGERSSPLHCRFDALFEQASGCRLAAGGAPRSARDLLVDYLHGAAFAGPRPALRALRDAWPLLQPGLRAALA